MKRHILCIICILMTALAVHAQRTISGTITDSLGVPMPYASLFVQDLQQGAIADSNGHYEITNLPQGRHSIKVSFIGFRTRVFDIDVADRNLVMDVRMQEEVVSLDELVVLPNDMDFAHYIMFQLEKNIRPLKSRLTSYDITTRTHLAKEINLSGMPKRRTIRFLCSLMGWGKIFDIMLKYPEFAITMEEDGHFDKGTMKTSDLTVVNVTPRLTDSEMKSVKKKDWFMDQVAYDDFYDLVKKKIKSLKSKKSKYELQYRGSYEEGGKTIFIVEYGRTHVEIVDGCWQIRRIKYKSSNREIYAEFQPLSPSVYLPVSSYASFDINYEKYPKGKAKMALGYTYKNIK